MNDSAATRPLRILVVENHADTLEAMKLFLEDSGHEVSTSMTSHDAARSLAETDYQVLLCDIGLPDGTGWELMNQIGPRHPKLFAIAMSGFGMNADSVRSRAAGYRAHLLKPFRAAELEKLLAAAADEFAQGEE